MKIALPTRNNAVDDHFGHCEYFTVVSVDNNEIKEMETVSTSQTCGCKSNIIDTLKNKGVSVMLAGNIGQGAINKINSANIKVIRGCSGSIEETVKEYLKGNIKDSLIVCNQHSDNQNDHQCNH